MPDPGIDLRWACDMQLSFTRRQLKLLAAAIIASILLLCTWRNQEHVQSLISASLGHDRQPICRQLPGAEDVVVIMKTGANEIEQKLAVHLNTTLTCYPNQIIFSDYEEDLPTGQHLYDAFTYTSSELKETHSDFALWRKLQAEGRAGLSSSELSGTDSREKLEDIRKTNPSWRLDKWKFLPMVNQTLGLYPDKHWYVFVEADTYLLWSNLLPYLAERSWEQDHYIGAQAIIQSRFGHGGSGFLLSRSALEKVVAVYQKNQTEWEHVEGYWVGDHVLATALEKAGVLLEDGRPTWQGKPVNLMEFDPTTKSWCSPAMTFHHQGPAEIEELWKFEQALISRRTNSHDGTHQQSNLLRHRDVFEQFVLPQIQEHRLGWDNKAEFLRRAGVASFEECASLCEQDGECMQYAYYADGECRVAPKVILGEAAEGVESGWLVERIQKSVAEAPGCKGS